MSGDCRAQGCTNPTAEDWHDYCQPCLPASARMTWPRTCGCPCCPDGAVAGETMCARCATLGCYQSDSGAWGANCGGPHPGFEDSKGTSEWLDRPRGLTEAADGKKGPGEG